MVVQKNYKSKHPLDWEKGVSNGSKLSRRIGKRKTRKGESV